MGIQEAQRRLAKLLLLLFLFGCAPIEVSHQDGLLDSLSAQAEKDPATAELVARELLKDAQHRTVWTDDELIQIRLLLVRSCNRQKKYEESYRILEELTASESLDKLAPATSQLLASRRGNTYFYTKQFNLANKAYREGLAFGLLDSMVYHQLLSNLSICEYEMGRHEEAKKLDLQSIQYIPQANRSEMMGTAFLNLGVSYLELDDLDSGRYFLNQARKYPDSLENLPYILLNLGYIDELEEKYSDAVKHYRKGHQVARELGDQHNMLATLHNQAFALTKKGDTMHAFFTMDSLIVLQDSFAKGLAAEDLVELEAKFKNTLQEAELEALKKQNRLTYIIFALSLGLVGLIAWLVITLFRSRLRKSQLKVERLETEKDIASLSNLIKGQEDERERIAKDLHDGVGISLSTLRFSIAQSEGGQGNEQLLEMLDEATTSIRDISYNLMPGTLVKLGLKDAIDDLINKVKNVHRIECNYQVDGEHRFAKKDAIWVFRIVQELINNTIKHSGATSLSLKMTSNETAMQIRYSDNGSGISAERLATAQGSGLENIQSRVRGLGGRITVLDASQVKGYSCEINIPYRA